jgi:putative colanic acid biosynthesis acetyltransferase WcaF
MRFALDRFDNRQFRRGRPAIVEFIWMAVQALLVSSFLPGSAHRRALLRLFGARIGAGVVIKPGVRVKFPWRLAIGQHSWIGEGVWIDNLADVTIGDHCCLSQEAYLCTGSHDWSKPEFDLIVKPIRVADGSWVAARAVLGPGTVVGEGAIVGLGSVATGTLEPFGIYRGNPALQAGMRRPGAASGAEEIGAR